MTEQLLHGGCHCGAIRVEARLPDVPSAYRPRVCDCDFCRKHGAAYVSDPAGSLRIGVADFGLLGRYRQGSGTAECLLCTRCGVLVAVAYAQDGRRYATLNSRIVDAADFGEPLVVSPKALGVAAKVERWTALWFGDVAIGLTPETGA